MNTTPWVSASRMVLAHVQEGRHYSFDDLVETLYGDRSSDAGDWSSDAANIIESWQRSDILRKFTRERGISYSFTYVGLLFAPGVSLFVAPKIYELDALDESQVRATIPGVLGMIARYAERVPRGSTAEKESFFTSERGESTRLVPLVLSILADHAHSGPLSTSTGLSVVGVDEQIDWMRTIDSQLPYPDGPSMVYLDYVGTISRTDEEDVVRALHKSVVARCENVLAGLGLSFLAPAPSGYEDHLDHLTSRYSAVALLENRERRTFRDSDKAKILLILGFLGLEYRLALSDDYLMMGCRAFQNVWEDACKYVLGNQLSTPNIRDETRNAVTRFNFFANEAIEYSVSWRSLWRIGAGGQLGSPLEPDIVISGRMSDPALPAAPYFFVIDAKYYAVSDEAAASSLPGTPDVMKQVLYEYAFAERLSLSEPAFIRNMFLFPSTEGPTRVFGEVKLPFLSPLRCHNVELVHMSLTAVSEAYCYLQRGSLRGDLLALDT